MKNELNKELIAENRRLNKVIKRLIKERDDYARRLMKACGHKFSKDVQEEVNNER